MMETMCMGCSARTQSSNHAPCPTPHQPQLLSLLTQWPCPWQKSQPTVLSSSPQCCPLRTGLNLPPSAPEDFRRREVKVEATPLFFFFRFISRTALQAHVCFIARRLASVCSTSAWQVSAAFPVARSARASASAARARSSRASPRRVFQERTSAAVAARIRASLGGHRASSRSMSSVISGSEGILCSARPSAPVKPSMSFREALASRYLASSRSSCSSARRRRTRSSSASSSRLPRSARCSRSRRRAASSSSVAELRAAARRARSPWACSSLRSCCHRGWAMSETISTWASRPRETSPSRLMSRSRWVSMRAPSLNSWYLPSRSSILWAWSSICSSKTSMRSFEEPSFFSSSALRCRLRRSACSARSLSSRSACSPGTTAAS
mmetsp:Transcript_2143/g.3565  ORF Transcript_2143/g.3565 Transcript_2143/m.3565 type:complete len:382 (+) Transcript_2143:566-1711(+)